MDVNSCENWWEWPTYEDWLNGLPDKDKLPGSSWAIRQVDLDTGWVLLSLFERDEDGDYRETLHHRWVTLPDLVGALIVMPGDRGLDA